MNPTEKTRILNFISEHATLLDAEDHELLSAIGCKIKAQHGPTNHSKN